MSIEIRQPEIEALIEERMSTGAFHNVEEVLIHVLKSAPGPKSSNGASSQRTDAELVAAMQAIPYGTEDTEPKQNLADFLLNSPLHGSGVVIKRSNDAPRIIEF